MRGNNQQYTHRYTDGFRNKPRDSFSFYFLISAVYTDELLNCPEEYQPQENCKQKQRYIYSMLLCCFDLHRAFDLDFFSSFSLDKIMFPLLLFFINTPFHSGCRSSYPSIVKSTLLLTSTPTDLPLSFIHPSQDHYPYSFHGVSS